MNGTASNQTGSFITNAELHASQLDQVQMGVMSSLIRYVRSFNWRLIGYAYRR